MAEIYFKEESFKIIGICMRIHSVLGPGFLESVYQEAVEKEFIKEGIPYVREKVLRVQFGDEVLNKSFRVDFMCFGEILLELKAVSFMPAVFRDILLNYLKASGKKLGILVNFGEKSLNYKRIVN